MWRYKFPFGLYGHVSQRTAVLGAGARPLAKAQSKHQAAKATVLGAPQVALDSGGGSLAGISSVQRANFLEGSTGPWVNATGVYVVAQL